MSSADAVCARGKLGTPMTPIANSSGIDSRSEVSSRSAVGLAMRARVFFTSASASGQTSRLTATWTLSIVSARYACERSGSSSGSVRGTKLRA